MSKSRLKPLKSVKRKTRNNSPMRKSPSKSRSRRKPLKSPMRKSPRRNSPRKSMKRKSMSKSMRRKSPRRKSPRRKSMSKSRRKSVNRKSRRKPLKSVSRRRLSLRGGGRTPSEEERKEETKVIRRANFARKIEALNAQEAQERALQAQERALQAQERATQEHQQKMASDPVYKEQFDFKSRLERLPIAHNPNPSEKYDVQLSAPSPSDPPLTSLTGDKPQLTVFNRIRWEGTSSSVELHATITPETKDGRPVEDSMHVTCLLFEGKYNEKDRHTLNKATYHYGYNTDAGDTLFWKGKSSPGLLLKEEDFKFKVNILLKKYFKLESKYLEYLKLSPSFFEIDQKSKKELEEIWSTGIESTTLEKLLEDFAKFCKDTHGNFIWSKEDMSRQ